MANNEKSISYLDYLTGVDRLRPEEQQSLIEILSSRLKKTVSRKTKSCSILELEGLGAEEWKGVEAQGYVRKERQSWDDSMK